MIWYGTCMRIFPFFCCSSINTFCTSWRATGDPLICVNIYRNVTNKEIRSAEE